MCHFFIPLYTDLLHKINFLAGSDKKPSPYQDKAAVLRLPLLPSSCIFWGCQITQMGMGTVRKCHFVCLGADDNKMKVTFINTPPPPPPPPSLEKALLFFLCLIVPKSLKSWTFHLKRVNISRHFWEASCHLKVTAYRWQRKTNRTEETWQKKSH